jgi:hypothetical protein
MSDHLFVPSNENEHEATIFTFVVSRATVCGCAVSSRNTILGCERLVLTVETHVRTQDCRWVHEFFETQREQHSLHEIVRE